MDSAFDLRQMAFIYIVAEKQWRFNFDINIALFACNISAKISLWLLSYPNQMWLCNTFRAFNLYKMIKRWILTDGL